MIKAGIIGASGYVGCELARILSSHGGADLEILSSRRGDGAEYGSIYPHFLKSPYTITETNIEAAADACDVVFIAAPHGVAAGMVSADILKKTRVIDMGADFRLKDPDAYEKWYGLKHPKPELIAEAAYGLTELNRDEIKSARLIANPGCYPTAAALALYPLIAEGAICPQNVVINAMSGVSGAGRDVRESNLFCETNESLKPYGVATHRHTPEIEQTLSLGAPVTVSFAPVLAPISRGILAISTAELSGALTVKDIADIYDKYYTGEFFIRVLPPGEMPQTRWVKGSNFTDIGFALDGRTNRVIICSVIDNMVKGASGQAIANMNIMFGLPERQGLSQFSVFP